MLKLLCVTSHPDDEAGAFGGVLARYADAGVECSVLCLTAGERAANRAGAADDEALKVMRRKEFADSCHHLGVAHCQVLNYPDGALDRADFLAITGNLVQAIRTLRPHIVLTFGAEGFVTGHPDHGMTGLFASAAFQWAARATRCTAQLDQGGPNQGGPNQGGLNQGGLNQGGLNQGGLNQGGLNQGLTPWQAKKLYYVTTEFFLPERPAVSLAPVTARIDIAPYIQRKNEAFACHVSQRVLQPLFVNAQQRAGDHELFHLAATAQVTPMAMETDLFAGITE